MMVWEHVELECDPATVQNWMSFCGATKGARGQQGMRTFCGHVDIQVGLLGMLQEARRSCMHCSEA